ncbi:MAG TPA: dynamin family protein [Chitinispirillaceae bacterium]|nr:dynamin family protein [Chitinispirillaceae bacterium]
MEITKSSGKIELNKQSTDGTGSDSAVKEPMSIDEIIDSALVHCQGLPYSCSNYVAQIKELRSRLSRGQLHLAVLGQFNRGKSTFINALIRQKILPTSVLPVTSVPTFISYNDCMSCTVRFLNNKPDLVVKQSIEYIVATLSKYVAEENNPKNQFCVRDVQIACPSPILQNGTVLIDTPGFGSTYVHNTRTALDALVDCDAALFLLSSDPPMTQTEVEFLKQVQQYVPRIFFILNKIDLLRGKDIEKVDLFIRQMLVTRLGYSSDVKLFHVCASRAEKAVECTEKNPDWVAGNMELVKSEILEFMVREKYFTLSQALNDKLKDAFKGITDCLQKDVNDFKFPMESLKKEIHELSTQFDSIKKNMEKELRLIQIEKDAVFKYINERFISYKEQMEQQVFAHLDNLLNNSSGSLAWIQGITTSIGAYITDSFSHLLLTMTAQINKPIRKATSLHSKEYASIADSVQMFVLGTNRKSFFLEKLDNMEIAIEETWKAENISDMLDTRLTWSDRFRNRESKVARIHQKWDATIKNAISTNFEALELHLKEMIEVIFEKLKSVLSEEYYFLSQDLDSLVDKKKTAIKERLNRKDNPVDTLEKLTCAFAKLNEELH